LVRKSVEEILRYEKAVPLMTLPLLAAVYELRLFFIFLNLHPDTW
jgi:hypothetical protein